MTPLMKIRLMKRAALVAVAGTVLVGCGSVKIRQLVSNPAHYQGKDIRVTGEVSRSTGLVVAGVYEVDDGTGKINVLSNRPIPRKGAKVTVRGRMQSGIQVLGRSVGTVVQEQSVQVHN
jgi:cytochrome c-type biogenesis protein CcmE